ACLPRLSRSRTRTLERPGAVAADIDTFRRESAVRLLYRGLDSELRARLDVGLGADFITHDVGVGGNNDALVAFLVLDDETWIAATCGRQDRTGRLDIAVGHRAVLRAIPAR